MDAGFNEKGTYILLLELDERLQLTVGRRLRVQLEPGWYGYVGSAHGPGGLAARLRRHVVGSPRRHWHVDYLRPHVSVAGALVKPGADRMECVWARWLDRVARECVTGFGSSDCRCSGHLFFLGGPEIAHQLVDLARTELGAHFVPTRELSDT